MKHTKQSSDKPARITVQTVLTPELMERFDKLCEEEHRPRSEMLRVMIIRYLEANK
jgi:metal-responsive CopG/Arc/MetJ family transcriptional regulator